MLLPPLRSWTSAAEVFFLVVGGRRPEGLLYPGTSILELFQQSRAADRRIAAGPQQILAVVPPQGPCM